VLVETLGAIRRRLMDRERATNAEVPRLEARAEGLVPRAVPGWRAAMLSAPQAPEALA
jgi:hypothetical protein